MGQGPSRDFNRAGQYPFNPRDAPGAGDNAGNPYSSRGGRPSQSNLTNIFSSSHREREREREGPQDEAGLAQRRETKAEREARKVERERLIRERERERSMREESVDGGFLVTQGVYTGPEDYNRSIVRTLMIDRRLAPFWPGLNDHSDSWAEHQLIAAVHGRPIPGADEPPTEAIHWQPADGPQITDASSVPTNSEQIGTSPNYQYSTSPLSSSPPPSGGSLVPGRAKGVASLTMPSASRGSSSGDLAQRETTLRPEPTINGQRLEVYLYKDANECPICFLYYPPYLNRTRCCDQPICSECFVQIKRPDPHPPEHHDDPNNPTTQAQVTQEREQSLGEITLVSEPAQCPYCAQPEFGITFVPPPIRRGLVFGGQASSSPSPLPSPSSPSPIGGRKRAASLPATASSVITTDRVRPEWSNKLATARAHAARRSAAATALHTAAYLTGPNRERRLPLFGRRGISNRGIGNEELGEGSTAGNENVPGGRQGEALDIAALMQAAARGGSGRDGAPDGQRGSSRRTRAEEIEEMMVLEAIRMSLATEDERHKKEEKEKAKEEKKKAKEEKKAQKDAQKAARKASGGSSSFYGLRGGSRSNVTVNSTHPSMASQDSAAGTSTGKGKGLARERSSSNPYGGPSQAGDSLSADAQAHLERSRANLQPPSESYPGSSRPSHLRNLSNASSSASSLVEPSPNMLGMNMPRAAASSERVEEMNGTPPGGNNRLEDMNFRSLISMIQEGERERANSDNDGITMSQTQRGSEKDPGSTQHENGIATSSTNGGVKHGMGVTSEAMSNTQVG